MSIKTSVCCSSSTSTSNLYQRQTTYSNSSTQTIDTNDTDNEDEYGHYEELYLSKTTASVPTTPISKSTLCRTNRYSVGCWTKPAYLVSN